MRACVVVLGDLARSPRMVNHAESLAAQGVDVDVIGYGRSLPYGGATQRIAWHCLDEPAALPSGSIRYVVAGAVRTAWLSVRLLRLLLTVPRPDLIVVQTPPAMPALAVTVVGARLRSSRLVLDWHNLTHSVLALRFGRRHILVRAVASYERVVGRLAGAHLCVSSAMADTLQSWGIVSQVARDRPSARFQQTRQPGDDAARRLVVVPSSWSADDDFDLLFDAIDRCEALIAASDEADPGHPFPSIDVVLTGRGPGRDRYQRLIDSRRARRVHVKAEWLSAEGYARLLGAADLGVSIHRSASGVDLPMKICDMFGSGVPVCALDYGPCLAELVHEGDNGRLFTAADQLARQLVDLLGDLPCATAALDRLRRGAVASSAVRWHEGWLAEAWPTLRGGAR
jgi:beta-1,4-mannosyltransferase